MTVMAVNTTGAYFATSTRLSKVRTQEAVTLWVGAILSVGRMDFCAIAGTLENERYMKL